LPSDNAEVTEKHAVECLGCGGFRVVERARTERLDPGECAKCGYLGWALAADLSDPARRRLRERPPARRVSRLRAV
jgi:hypothetical protein